MTTAEGDATASAGPPEGHGARFAHDLGGPDVRILDDGWTVVTADGRLSAQFEHTLLVTPTGVEILTPREGILENSEIFPNFSPGSAP